MDMTASPLVSIVTPVYNGADYLEECIASVLAQTYEKWNYVVVDNCSNDNSTAIAEEFARKDHRIRVIRNEEFLPIIANHNRAIRQISSDSRFCKIVFADDWLFPTCIEEMVRVAVENPSVGLVGTYTMDGEGVLWGGPSYPCSRAPGWEICRKKLLGGPYIFGTMTSLLVRSDLVRKRASFFNERNLHADHEACFEVLQESDFGFVHQVLSYTRRRPGSNTSFANDFDSTTLGEFLALVKFGPVFLSPAEYRRRYSKVRWEYYRVLAHNVLRMRAKVYWDYHKRTLAAFATSLDLPLLAAALFAEIGDYTSHPVRSIRHGLKWWFRAMNRAKNILFAKLHA